MFNLPVAITIFLGSLLIDILWTFTVMRTAEKKALESAFFSSAVTLLAGLITIEYVQNRWYLIPAALGGFMGNYLTLKWELRHNKPATPPPPLT
jgi:hypothetical protein